MTTINPITSKNLENVPSKKRTLSLTSENTEDLEARISKFRHTLPSPDPNHLPDAESAKFSSKSFSSVISPPASSASNISPAPPSFSLFQSNYPSFFNPSTPKQPALQTPQPTFQSLHANPELSEEKIKEIKEKLIPVLDAYNSIHQSYSSEYVHYTRIQLHSDDILIIKADIHGNFNCSFENFLEKLKKLKYLSNEGVIQTVNGKKCFLVFLGDYMDKGEDSFSVLTQLIQLYLNNYKNENGRVLLIKGNHEDVSMNILFLQVQYFQMFQDIQISLKNFYSTLPVQIYVKIDDNNKRILLTHGGIDPHIDPIPYSEEKQIEIVQRKKILKRHLPYKMPDSFEEKISKIDSSSPKYQKLKHFLEIVRGFIEKTAKIASWESQKTIERGPAKLLNAQWGDPYQHIPNYTQTLTVFKNNEPKQVPVEELSYSNIYRGGNGMLLLPSEVIEAYLKLSSIGFMFCGHQHKIFDLYKIYSKKTPKNFVKGLNESIFLVICLKKELKNCIVTEYDTNDSSHEKTYLLQEVPQQSRSLKTEAQKTEEKSS